jgi:hypothetical protein
MHQHSRAALALVIAFAVGVLFWLTTDHAPVFVPIGVALAVFGACVHAFGPEQR